MFGAEYVPLDDDISKKVYASVYELELLYDDNMFLDMNKKQIEDFKLLYRKEFEEYLSEPAILVLKKAPHRQERIDIKPYIIDYEFLIDNRLRITVYTSKEKNLNPEYIMAGYLEYINRNIDYNIRRIKILYK